MLFYCSGRQQQGTKQLFNASRDQIKWKCFYIHNIWMKYDKCYHPMFWLAGSFWVWIAFCRDRGFFVCVFLFIQSQLVVQKEKISSRLKALLKISHKVNPLNIIININQFTAIYYILCTISCVLCTMKSLCTPDPQTRTIFMCFVVSTTGVLGIWFLPPPSLIEEVWFSVLCEEP